MCTDVPMLLMWLDLCKIPNVQVPPAARPRQSDSCRTGVWMAVSQQKLNSTNTVRAKKTTSTSYLLLCPLFLLQVFGV
jgi:hypothetical protein